jgi:hypothetical protein
LQIIKFHCPFQKKLVKTNEYKYSLTNFMPERPRKDNIFMKMALGAVALGNETAGIYPVKLALPPIEGAMGCTDCKSIPPLQGLLKWH